MKINRIFASLAISVLLFAFACEEAATGRKDAGSHQDDGGGKVADEKAADAGKPAADQEQVVHVCAGGCGAGKVCYYGICRDPCDKWCIGKESGDICREGACVECEGDSGCTSGMICDRPRFACVPRPPPDPSMAIVGVMYHQWWFPGRWQEDPRNHAYEPALGHYDNSDPAVLRQHLAWSREAGINTWVFDTWITDRDWWWVEKNTKAAMDEADADGSIRYFLLVDGWFELTGNDDGYDSTAIARKIIDRFSTWLDRPGYVKVDGKPALFFWASWGKTCLVFDRIRSVLEASLGPVFLTGNNGDNACFDRVMEYNSYTGESGDYDAQIERQDDLFRGWSRDGRPWAPTCIPGYNDTFVREGNPPVPLDPDFFRRSLKTAFKYDQRAVDPWLFVCSWSEWHEGSQIEPSADFDDPEVFLKVMGEELEQAGWVRR